MPRYFDNPCAECGDRVEWTENATDRGRPDPRHRKCGGGRRTERRSYACASCGGPCNPGSQNCRKCYAPNRGVEWRCVDCGVEVHRRSVRCKPCRGVRERNELGTKGLRRAGIRRLSRVVYFPDCQWCGDLFTAKRPRKYCSIACDYNSRDRSERTLSLYRTAKAQGCRPKYWRVDLLERLWERDRGLCAVCEHPVELGVKSGPRGHDHGPSVEHLTPWSKTADSSWENLGISHWGCNRDRRTKDLGEVWAA